jgi:voltage-gated potassium channel
VGNIVVVLFLYFLLPLDRPFGWSTALALLGGLACVALLTAWQVRSVLRSAHPGLRAVETLAMTVSLFLVLFAACYQQLAVSDPSTFSEPLSRTDSLYFVITVFATVGFGDISPVTAAARVLTSLQMIGDLVLIGLLVKTMFNAVERGRALRQKAAPPAEVYQVAPAPPR